MGFKFKTFYLVFLSCFAVVLTAGCNKHKYPDHIIAGEKSGRHIYYSGSLGIEIYPHSNTSNFHDWEIDINNDGTNDCILEYYASIGLGSQSCQISIKPVGSQNCAFVIANSSGNYVDTIPSNTIIDDNKLWHHGGCILYHYAHNPSTTSKYGLWDGVKNKYVGVRAMAGEHTIFGWLRIEINGFNLKFFDYAGTGD
ncbi:MAG: hypothetical protein KAH26_12175 [Bacteroidales bacterium]|nr:hypothetical protein [Bacteroidales bacterium]